MTSDHKKPGVAFWLTVAVAGLVLYVATIGPACWLHAKFGGPQWSESTIEFVWAPLGWAVSHLPSGVGTAFQRYAEWWLELGSGP